MESQNLSIGEAAAAYGLPEWRIRRTVDELGEEIPRIGPFRVITPDLFGKLTAELQRRGYLKTEEATA